MIVARESRCSRSLLYFLLASGSLTGTCGDEPYDSRAAIGVGLAPDQRFQKQKEFLGKHDAAPLAMASLDSSTPNRCNSITSARAPADKPKAKGGSRPLSSAEVVQSTHQRSCRSLSRGASR